MLFYKNCKLNPDSTPRLFPTLDRALSTDPKFIEPEYPFEWAGIYHLTAGTHRLVLQVGPDSTINTALLPAQEATANALEALKMEAVLRFSENSEQRQTGQSLQASATALYTLQLNDQPATFPLTVEQPGPYVLYSQHLPSEFQLEVHGANGVLDPILIHEYKPKHEHDDEVTSVGIEVPGDLDATKLNTWLSNLLRTQGTDIFRMKGVLSMKGEPNRFVFQGVHMLFDGRPDRPWDKSPRRNSLIFIGRNLDRAKLNEGFRTCLA
jgi:G3E family GTPase